MKTKIALVVAGVLAAFVSPAMAQFRTHSDFGGYTYRTPSTTYMYRYDSGATYNRIGNFATYSANNGTTGNSYYAPTYRYDSFSNARQGWSGSGTTFYTPSYSTYSRTYYTPSYSAYSGGSWRPSYYRLSPGLDVDSDLDLDGDADLDLEDDADLDLGLDE